MDDILDYKPDSEEDFYKILGCDEQSNTEQITTEYKARVLSCHPDKHPGNVEAEKSFKLLQQAKEILCDEEKRKRYDQWRGSGIAMSFKQWCSLRDSVQTSMHWGSVKTNPMIEHDKPGTSRDSSSQVYKKSDVDYVKINTYNEWRRDAPSEMLRKFRNYEI